ncbi:MAG TPA: hypothetical protein PKC13_08695, partial [Blastocatellia bacterium]|nr:hypothetical protein [Blastocatellia bacterium]
MADTSEKTIFVVSCAEAFLVWEIKSAVQQSNRLATTVERSVFTWRTPDVNRIESARIILKVQDVF